ncbi:hypothetical protein ROHU_021032 [Labeo rohita]|uniref:Uncharacterized protein n=1 Tax=Labeo rohita TaxID=84645 RepID=A0A498MW49_LABRO|nr:hypothetical protein ROHU_021032 [Labeo rohita]
MWVASIFQAMIVNIVFCGRNPIFKPKPHPKRSYRFHLFVITPGAMAEAIKHPEREEKNVLRATIYIQQILMHEISEMSDGALFLRRDLMMLRLPMGEMATVERVLVIL